MLSINTNFQRTPIQLSTRALDAMQATTRYETRHEIADGFLKSIVDVGSADEVAFAKTVRSAASRVSVQHQKVILETLGLQMLSSGGVQGALGLGLAHFGRLAYDEFQSGPGYVNDFSQPDGAAAEIMRSIEKHAELGQTQVAPAVFDFIISGRGGR